MQLSRDHVIWAYRLFLNREPESPELIDEHLRLAGSVDDLQRAFLTAPEFLQRRGEVNPFGNANVVIKELSGFRLFIDLSDLHVGLTVINEAYELESQRLIHRTLRHGQVALDVGSNIGFFSMLLASRVGPEGHVYAFEPLSRNATLFEKSVAENKFEARITLRRAAVGEQNGQRDLVFASETNNSGGAYLRTTAAVVPSGHEVISVPVAVLDECSMRRPIHFMKLDVEGAELLVLRGARRLLSEDRPTVLAEINPKQLAAVSHCTPGDVLREMAQHGYRCCPLAREGLLPAITEYEGAAVGNVVFLPD